MTKYIIIGLSILFLITCSSNLPISIGKTREVVILSNHIDAIKKILSNILERPIYTVQPEPEFLIKYLPLSSIDRYYRFHTLFIIGSINEEPINSLLKLYVKKILKDTFGLYNISDLWAKNQKVFIFAVSDLKYLTIGLTKYKNKILKTLRNHQLENISKLTYAHGYDKNLEKILIHKYNFSLKLPNSFKLNAKYCENNFLYFVAHNPERSVFVYFSNNRIPLEPENAICLRDSLTALFYEGDYVYQLYTCAETTNFNNNLALKLIGVWQNNKYYAGGPFISYMFYRDTLLYFIDGMVFNPGQKKLNYLIQLDAILHTFKESIVN
ncbi:MAG: DUF4837 family protein [candidate division WOR-3 bacterium]